MASQYVITAAHCMFENETNPIPIPKTDIKVIIGEHDLLKTNETFREKTVAVSEIINHPDYVPKEKFKIHHDITVLKLAKEVDLDIYTPACLAQTTDESTFDDKTAQVYGWGFTSKNAGQASNILLEIDVKVLKHAKCSHRRPKIHPGQICADAGAGKDACDGDSGGPLTVESNGQLILIGDASFGGDCGTVIEIETYEKFCMLCWLTPLPYHIQN